MSLPLYIIKRLWQGTNAALGEQVQEDAGKRCMLVLALWSSSCTNGLAGFLIPWWNSPEGGSLLHDSELKKLEASVQLSLSSRNLSYVLPCEAGPYFLHLAGAREPILILTHQCRLICLPMQWSMYWGWKQLGRKFPFQIPLDTSVISSHSFFPPDLFSQEWQKLPIKGQIHFLCNFSMCREDWIICSSSAFQV